MVNIHNKIKIMEYLLSNKEEKFSINAISQKTSLDYKVAYMAVKELAEEKALAVKKIGQAVLCSANPKQFALPTLMAEYERRRKVLNNKTFRAIKDYFDNIKEPFFILLLFGSYALKKQRKTSDIDLMLITDSQQIKNKIEDKISLIPLKIHLLSFTSSEFASMINTTKFNVGREAFSNNIILEGVEDYYRLIKNA